MSERISQRISELALAVIVLSTATLVSCLVLVFVKL